MSPSRFRRTAAVAAAAALLSSCGVTDSQVAARVGDAEISMSEVDGVARALCTGTEPQLEEAGQTLPMTTARQASLNLLTLTAVANQLADEYDVTPGAVYERQRAQSVKAAEELPEEQREDYVTAGSVDALMQGVWVETGELVLAEEGVTEPEEGQAMQRGAELFWSWPERLELELNPVYDVYVKDGQLEPANGADDIGVPVSDTALAPIAKTPDPSVAAALPDHLRCG